MRRAPSLIAFLALPLFLLFALPAGFVAGARAKESPPLPILLEDIELLPIHEIEWAMVLHEHPDLVTRLMFLGKRIERVHEHLKARSNPDDAGSQKLLQEIQRIALDIAPHLERLLKVIEPLGIDADVLRVLDGAPRGRLRLERQAVRIVRKVPDLDARQRALHARLGPAVEGALLALEAADSEEGAVLSQTIQRRFWRVVDATLDVEQRVWVRRRLPTKMGKVADLLGHLYVLPELTVSQGARIKSLLVRLEQEAAPDTAIGTRVEAALKDTTLDGAERRRLQQEKAAADRRNVERAVYAWREGTTILTAAQMVELKSVPPLLTAKDRPGDLEVLMKELDFTPDQRPALHALHRKYGPAKGRLAGRLARLAIRAEGMGPDSPQQDEMQILQAQAWGEAVREARRAAGEFFRDVLTTDQILTWVIAAP